MMPLLSVRVFSGIKKRGLDPLAAAQAGTQAGAKPVFLAVLSTMIFFSPIFFLPGLWAKFLWAIPAVTIVALSFSLIESLWILPSHLAQMKPSKPPTTKFGTQLLKVRQACSSGLTRFGKNIFQPLLKKALRWHYLTLTLFFLALTLSLTLVGAGYVKQVTMPNVASDFISMRLSMPDGHSKEAKLDIMKRAEHAADQLTNDAVVQESVVTDRLIANQLSFMWGDTIRLLIELTPEVSGENRSKARRRTVAVHYGSSAGGQKGHSRYYARTTILDVLHFTDFIQC